MSHDTKTKDKLTTHSVIVERGDSAWEAEEVVRAIREGEVDAIVVYGPATEKVFVLENADYPYRHMLDALREGAALMTKDSCILHCNSHLAKLAGVSKEQLLGSQLRNRVRENQRAGFDELLEHAGRETNQAEIELVTEQGTPVPLKLTISPMQVEDVPALCLIAADLKDIRQAEAALQANQDFHAQIVGSAREGIVVLDRNLHCRIWNRYMAEITGISSERALRRPLNELITIHGQNDPDQPLRRALEGANSYFEIYFTVPASGRAGWASIIYSPLRNETDECIGVLALIRDISEERRLKQELSSALEQLQKLSDRLQIPKS